MLFRWQAVIFSSIIFAEETESRAEIGREDNLTERMELKDFLVKNKKTKKPNIVIILADDVGTGDLPFYWEGLDTSKVHMPHLQELANNGLLFTDAHSSPLCAPSRYMLLSGNYPHRGKRKYGTWDLDEDSGQFKKNQKSIAEVLRMEGYETAIFGKWHLGGKIPPNGIQTKGENLTKYITEEGHDWSLPLIEGPGDTGFDRSYFSTGGIQYPPYSFFRDDILTTKPSEAKYWNKGTYQMPHGESMIHVNPRGNGAGEGDPNWDSSAYDMIIVNETRAFIDNHLASKPDDPFFAYVALGTVHVPHSPPDVYLDGSRVRGVYKTPHLDMLGAMDKAVGSIVSMIEEKNLAKETIIIFTSDNGGINVSNETGHRTSGRLRGEKGEIWEGGHRVPLIIRYDNNFQAGGKREKMVGLNDIYATICELVGIDVPVGSAQDSVSFARYIKKKKDKEGLRKYLGMFKLTKYRQHAIRKGNLKLIHTLHNNTFELYNLQEDISEKRNIINLPWITKQNKIAPMIKKLREIRPK